MQSAPHPFAEEKRRTAIEAATAMGIDDTLIDRLVDGFYGRVRQDATLAPIFERVIGDQWAHHLPKMKAFWGAIVFSDGRYSGRPVPAHLRLKEVTPENFDVWLQLFQQTLDELAPTQEAKRFLMQRADRIAESLKKAMFFGVPTPPEAHAL
jgi:hemoglobin